MIDDEDSINIPRADFAIQLLATGELAAMLATDTGEDAQKVHDLALEMAKRMIALSPSLVDRLINDYIAKKTA